MMLILCLRHLADSSRPGYSALHLTSSLWIYPVGVEI